MDIPADWRKRFEEEGEAAVRRNIDRVIYLAPGQEAAAQRWLDEVAKARHEFITTSDRRWIQVGAWAAVIAAVAGIVAAVLGALQLLSSDAP